MTALAGGVDPENVEEGAEEKSASDRDSSYVVQRGDTLAGVALRLGVKQSELKRANHMYGSRTLVAGQVLKTSGPVKSASKEKIVYPVPAEPLPAAQRKPGSASEAGAGAASASSSAFTVAVTAPGIAPAAAAAAAEEDGILVEPPEEEVWFEDSRGGQAGGSAGGTAAGAASSSSSSSLMAPVEETMVRPAPAPSDELLYEPPHWGGGGGSRSRQGSDASASAAASVRGMFNYIRSKAAAVVTTPTASDAAGSGSFFASGGGGDGGKISRRNSRQSNGGGDTGSHYASSSGGGGGGSMPSTPGFPSVDEGLAPAGLPPAEMWAGTRDDPGNAAAFAAAQSAARDVSEVAQSTAQAFLSMVKPSYWRTDSEGGGVGGGDAAGESPVGFGDGRRGEGGSSDQWVGVPGGAGSFEDTASTGSILQSLADEASLFSGDPGARPSPPPPKPPLKLPGLVCGGSTIVTHRTLARMEAAQPKHHRGYNWYLLYSTFRDGASYTTLYNRIKAEEPTFLIVESMRGEVFGGFATSAWSSGCQYYGTGECFLFKIEGERVAVESEEEETENDSDDHSGDGRTGSETAAEPKTVMEGDMTTFGWTGMNMYLQYSDSKGIAMGGGGADGSFGLFVGEDFLTGSTGKCDTYGNPPLCSQEQFQVSQVEVWGFTTADTEMGARLERLRKTLRGKTTRPL